MGKVENEIGEIISVKDLITTAFIAMLTVFLFVYFYQDAEWFNAIELSILAGVLGVFLSILWSPLFKHFILAFLLQRENKALSVWTVF